MDPNRSLVVLLYGLDSDRSDCLPIGQLLAQAGYQVASFGDPGDQSIRDSARSSPRQMRVLRDRFPQMAVTLIAHSMGGLVARDYVDGPDYAGGSTGSS